MRRTFSATQAVVLSWCCLRVDTVWSFLELHAVHWYVWCYGWDGGRTVGALVLLNTVAGPC